MWVWVFIPSAAIVDGISVSGCAMWPLYFLKEGFPAMGDTTTTTTESVNDHIANAAAEAADQVTEGSPALGEAGKKALQAERDARKQAEAARKDLEAQLKAVQAKVQEFEDADKTEVEKANAAVERANSQIAEMEARATAAETALLRYEIAQEKGITGKALDLLVGSTREELEAKADSILEITKHVTPANPLHITAEGNSPDTNASEEAVARQILLGQ